MEEFMEVCLATFLLDQLPVIARYQLSMPIIVSNASATIIAEAVPNAKVVHGSEMVALVKVRHDAQVVEHITTEDDVVILDWSKATMSESDIALVLAEACDGYIPFKVMFIPSYKENVLPVMVNKSFVHLVIE